MGEPVLFLLVLLLFLLLVFVFDDVVVVPAGKVLGSGRGGGRRDWGRDDHGNGTVCAVAHAEGVVSSSRSRSRGQTGGERRGRRRGGRACDVAACEWWKSINIAKFRNWRRMLHSKK